VRDGAGGRGAVVGERLKLGCKGCLERREFILGEDLVGSLVGAEHGFQRALYCAIDASGSDFALMPALRWQLLSGTRDRHPLLLERVERRRCKRLPRRPQDPRQSRRVDTRLV